MNQAREPLRPAASGAAAVVAIVIGVVLVTRKLFPPLYLFGMFLVPWLFILPVVSFMLTRVAAACCCQSTKRQGLFTLTLMLLLLLGGATFGPALLREGGPVDCSGPVLFYSFSLALVLAGLVLLAHEARRGKSSR